MSVVVRLTDQAFDPSAVLGAFPSGRDAVGALVSFTGLCRRDGNVTALELESYPGFTEPAVEREAQVVHAAHALLDLHVTHRVGRIAAGEAIVFVAASAMHRREAFEGADRMMDFLKSRAPFWKKEHTPSTARWIEPRPQDYDDAARWDVARALAPQDPR